MGLLFKVFVRILPDDGKAVTLLRIMVKRQAKELFLIISGLFLIIIGILSSQPVVASFTEDGSIGSGAIRAGLWGLSIGLIVIGLVVILLRKSEVVLRLVGMLVITAVLFLLVDFGLYLFSPGFSPELVRIMSPQAQLRYHDAHREEEGWIYQEHFRYGRPGAELDEAIADEFGYRNPAGYMDPVEKLDVLLIGDSFVWGTGDRTIADYMRAEWTGQSFYSAGVFGNSMVQWRYHFEDFLDRVGEAPETVVFNFYAGNDLSDTAFYRRVQGFVDVDTATSYYLFYNSPYLIPSEPGGLAPPKMPETAFLVMGILAAGEHGSAGPVRLATDYEVEEPWPIFNEPPGSDFQEGLLAEIDATVAHVRALAPNTKIVISYIPTVGGIYGDLLTDCSWCAADIEQQEENSAVLRGRAERLGVGYVDVTPVLREAALERAMWAMNGHFSEEGYRVYALALGEAIMSGG